MTMRLERSSRWPLPKSINHDTYRNMKTGLTMKKKIKTRAPQTCLLQVMVPRKLKTEFKQITKRHEMTLREGVVAVLKEAVALNG